MTNKTQNSFGTGIFGSTQRFFRKRNPHGVLASNQIDAHTMRDIGISPVGL